MGNFDLGRGGLSSRRCLFRSSCKIYSEDVLSVFFFFLVYFIHTLHLFDTIRVAASFLRLLRFPPFFKLKSCSCS